MMVQTFKCMNNYYSASGPQGSKGMKGEKGVPGKKGIPGDRAGLPCPHGGPGLPGK